MKTIKFNFILILCSSWWQMSTPTNIINQNIAMVQNEWLNCLLLIAQKKFIDGSSVAIVNLNQLNVALEMDTMGWIVKRMMQISRWSIVVKTFDAKNSSQKEVRKICD